MSTPFKYYILNEQEIESGALDLRYYTKTQADGKYVFKETGKQLIESTILNDLTDGGNTTLHTHDSKADKVMATNLVTNGDFSNGTSGWSASASSLSSLSNTLIVTASGSSAYGMAYQDTGTASIVGKKVYFKVKVRVTNASCSAIDLNVDGVGGGADQTSYLNLPIQNTWYDYSFVATQPIGVSGNIRLKITHSYVDAATASGKIMEVKYVQAIDLTSTFGAGNEPSKEQIDRLLSIYPNSWFNGTQEITNIKQVFNEKADRLFATNLVTNGDFSNGTTGWNVDNSALSVSSNTLTITGLATNTYVSSFSTMQQNIVAGNKYYLRMKVRVTNSVCSSIWGRLTFAGGTNTTALIQNTPMQDQWYSLSGVFSQTDQSGTTTLYVRANYADNATSNGKVTQVQYVDFINLTQIFGAGKEPNATQMDGMMASRYPNSWFNGTSTFLDVLDLYNTKLDKVKLNEVILDVTIDSAWSTTNLTYDNATQTFTMASHGFTNNKPLEFKDDVGVLPSGILPYNSDTSGGMYYNVINATTNTFQVTSTLGGTTPVTTTSNGTIGFKVRGADINLLQNVVAGLNLDVDLEYDIYVDFRTCKYTTAAMSFFLRLNGSSTFKYFHSNTTAYGTSSYTFTPSITNKFVICLVKINLRKIGSSLVGMTISTLGQQTDNKSTASPLSFIGGAIVLQDANVTGLAMVSNDANITRLRSGTRVIVVKRGAIT